VYGNSALCGGVIIKNVADTGFTQFYQIKKTRKFMKSSKQWELAKQIISEFPEYTFSGMDDIDQHHALPWLENLLTDTIKQAVEEKISEARKFALLPDPNAYGKWVSVKKHNEVVNEAFDLLENK